MSWKCEDVPDPTLSPAADRQAFELHLAALDWSLIDPIVINGAEDIKSRNWRDRGLEPFSHQIQNLITFCRRLPVALIADDVGLGKTISAGLILSELIARRRVNRALVISPKVLAPQWVAELDEKFGLVAKVVTGSALDDELRRSTPVVVTTYESARDRLEKIEPGTFDLCILDEAHKLRNLHGAANPPALARRVREALERRPFRYVLMLTATPIQNRIWDLYSLIDLLKVAEGKPNPLGDATLFRTRFLQPGTDGRKLRPGREREFQLTVRNSYTRTGRRDVRLSFPKRIVVTERVALDPAEREMIGIVAKHIAGLSPLMQTSIAQAMMSSPRALVSQAKNMAVKGTLQPDAAAALNDAASRLTAPAKLAALLKMLELLRVKKGDEWRAVIFTVRRETQEMIGEQLERMGIPFGFIRGDSVTSNQRTIDDYRGKPPMVNVIVSTDAGAEGINLQAGNVLINYDLPWNPMVVEQRIGRVQRLGSEHGNVVITNLVGAGTVEDAIVARLMAKLQGIVQAIGDIEGILDAADIEDDGESSFESRVRRMVVDALVGKDSAKATALLTENIEAARKLFEDNREEIDRTLGGAGDASTPARAVPKIDRKPPRLGYREFVLGARQSEGFRVRSIDADTYEFTGPGRAPERISFSESTGAEAPSIFAERPVRCYLPGKPPFERLVQRWVDRDAHHVANLTVQDRKAEDLARGWCERSPGCAFVAAEYRADEPAFQGVVYLKVRAGTGVDSFEKILRGRMAIPTGHSVLHATGDEPRLEEKVAVSRLISSFQNPIRQAVEKDAEVGQFCTYYLDRLKEGLSEAGADAVRRAKIEGDFQPYVQADVLALDGVHYDSGVVEVSYHIDGVEYGTPLLVVPATGQILWEPARERCSVTGIECPIDCLRRCEATGQMALQHRLVQTAAGFALPNEVVTCSLTGEQLLRTEAGVSAVSGKVVRANQLRRCEVTGDPALPDELAASELSGRMARPESLVVSEFSGRRGLPIETVRCSATGRTVLSDEAVRANATREWFARDQLQPSALSGTFVPPPDLVTCELTGDPVLADELAACAVSGRRVRRDRLLRSVVSGKPVLPDHQAVTHDGRTALPDEVGTCAWQGTIFLSTELAACRLSGLTVERRLLNSFNELLPLRSMLDGTSDGEPVPREDGPWMRRVTGWNQIAFGRAARFAAPAGGPYAVCVEDRRWFGLRRQFLGAIIRFGPDGGLRGTAVAGARRHGVWHQV
jgi:superfamily II DNA or RNA helicase